jgi:hypothetical protein
MCVIIVQGLDVRAARMIVDLRGRGCCVFGLGVVGWGMEYLWVFL